VCDSHSQFNRTTAISRAKMSENDDWPTASQAHSPHTPPDATPPLRSSSETNLLADSAISLCTNKTGLAEFCCLVALLGRYEPRTPIDWSIQPLALSTLSPGFARLASGFDGPSSKPCDTCCSTQSTQSKPPRLVALLKLRVETNLYAVDLSHLSLVTYFAARVGWCSLQRQ
jgi:hypothetical protein